MIIGSVAFVVYAALCVYLMGVRLFPSEPRRHRRSLDMGPCRCGGVYGVGGSDIMIIRVDLRALTRTQPSEWLRPIYARRPHHGGNGPDRGALWPSHWRVISCLSGDLLPRARRWSSDTSGKKSSAREYRTRPAGVSRQHSMLAVRPWGALALLVFAMLVWRLLPKHSPASVLLKARSLDGLRPQQHCGAYGGGTRACRPGAQFAKTGVLAPPPSGFPYGWPCLRRTIDIPRGKACIARR